MEQKQLFYFFYKIFESFIFYNICFDHGHGFSSVLMTTPFCFPIRTICCRFFCLFICLFINSVISICCTKFLDCLLFYWSVVNLLGSIQSQGKWIVTIQIATNCFPGGGGVAEQKSRYEDNQWEAIMGIKRVERNQKKFLCAHHIIEAAVFQEGKNVIHSNSQMQLFCFWGIWAVKDSSWS